MMMIESLSSEGAQAKRREENQSANLRFLQKGKKEGAIQLQVHPSGCSQYAKQPSHIDRGESFQTESSKTDYTSLRSQQNRNWVKDGKIPNEKWDGQIQKEVAPISCTNLHFSINLYVPHPPGARYPAKRDFEAIGFSIKIPAANPPYHLSPKAWGGGSSVFITLAFRPGWTAEREIKRDVSIFRHPFSSPPPSPPPPPAGRPVRWFAPPSYSFVIMPQGVRRKTGRV
ncbi:hypothetical protein TNIN_122301 [Trichonephila inaurata madagascariensis]|uniref:Uncharacterized protein n=1 Tax=Trichonephila inaurata madagascariensis TaxID=2747483 RepID=A0A8X7C545_9ARAC|nr:hypothetical protein TNIN_122301 [Trichonephila inaurata madagascariensis]